MSFENWLLFSSIALVATLSPGPAILLVSTHSLSYGLKRAVATMLGNVSGLLLMSALSVLGLSTVILYSTPVFMTLKFIGAAYLIYLGVKLWRQGFGRPPSAAAGVPPDLPKPRYSRLYSHGLFVALSNPKAIAFTTALFPQFVDHTQPVLPQFTILVTTFMLLSFSCLFGYAFLAENAKRGAGTQYLSRALSRVFGSAFIVSGVVLVNATQKQA